MSKIFVSVSGGETSWYMAKLLKDKIGHEHELVYVFANTGKEREETLEFNEKCSNLFGIDLIWVEAVVHHGIRKGCTHKVVDFNSASREGEPFRDVISKYGIPNVRYLHCTRELKTNPMRDFIKSIGWKNYKTAIGIRSDEIDRVSANHKKNKLIYPLVSPFPTSKPEINRFWSQQPFRLDLKSYEGNCDLCFKKTLRKLLTIISEGKVDAKWWMDTERDFETFSGNRESVNPPYRFNRGSMPFRELIELSKGVFEPSEDEKYNLGSKYIQQLLFNLPLDISNGCEESCEPFS